MEKEPDQSVKREEESEREKLPADTRRWKWFIIGFFQIYHHR
jgi:hypothetical protein